VFEAVARHLSFVRAADELAVTQSAVSHQIEKLEQSLGAQLFVRRTRAIDLTSAGRRSYDRVGSRSNGSPKALARYAAMPGADKY
jgi:LysR family transcriptional regulator, glycine cleavage system transcriptional activator